MRNFDDRIENSGATAPGRLSAAEDNVRFKEMENIVSTAGITLDVQAGPDTDFTMLAQAAARYASGGIRGTCSGPANTYTAAATGSFIVPKQLFDGMILIIKPSATNTAPSTLNAFSLGSKEIRTWDNQPLIAGKLILGMDTMLGYSTAANGGSGAWLVLPWCDLNDLWIKSDKTITVAATGGDFTTIQAALDSLRYKIIASDATVTISLAAQVHTLTSPIKPQHINGSRIVIKGQTPSSSWDSTDVVASSATTAATMRTKYSTEIVCNSCNGFEATRGQFLKLENILFTQTGSSGFSAVVSGDSLNAAMTATDYFGNGQVTMKNCFVIGFTYGLWARQMSNFSLDTIGVSHCIDYGVICNNGSYIVGRNILSMRNTGTGLYARDNSSIELTGAIISNNGSNGIAGSERGRFAITGVTSWQSLTNNGGWGSIANVGSFHDLASMTVTGNTSGSLFSQLGSFTAQTGTLTGASSPAALTIGNNNSYNWY